MNTTGPKPGTKLPHRMRPKGEKIVYVFVGVKEKYYKDAKIELEALKQKWRV